MKHTSMMTVFAAVAASAYLPSFATKPYGVYAPRKGFVLIVK